MDGGSSSRSVFCLSLPVVPSCAGRALCFVCHWSAAAFQSLLILLLPKYQHQLSRRCLNNPSFLDRFVITLLFCVPSLLLSALGSCSQSVRLWHAPLTTPLLFCSFYLLFIFCLCYGCFFLRSIQHERNPPCGILVQCLRECSGCVYFTDIGYNMLSAACWISKLLVLLP